MPQSKTIGATVYEKLVYLFDPTQPVEEGRPDNVRGYVQWADRQLFAAWVARALWLLDPARVEAGGAPHVIAVWRALQHAFMALNLQAAGHPAYRAMWRKWFSGVPTTPTGEYSPRDDFRTDFTSVPMEDSFTYRTGSRAKYDVTRAMVEAPDAEARLGILRVRAARRFMQRNPGRGFSLRFFCPAFLNYVGLLETCRHPLDYRGPWEDESRLPRSPQEIAGLVAWAAADNDSGPRGVRSLGNRAQSIPGSTESVPLPDDRGSTIDTWDYDLPALGWPGEPLLSVGCTWRDTLEPARELAEALAARTPDANVIAARNAIVVRNQLTIATYGGSLAAAVGAFADADVTAFEGNHDRSLGVGIASAALGTVGALLVSTGVGAVPGVILAAAGAAVSVLSGPLSDFFDGVGQSVARDEYGRNKPWLESAWMGGDDRFGPEHAVPLPPGFFRANIGVRGVPSVLAPGALRLAFINPAFRPGTPEYEARQRELAAERGDAPPAPPTPPADEPPPDGGEDEGAGRPHTALVLTGLAALTAAAVIAAKKKKGRRTP